LLSIIAALAFIAGYVISIITGIWSPNNSDLILTLIILGVIVGLLNITGREIMPYLVAAIALVVVGNLKAFTPLNDVRGGLGDDLNDIVRLMATFTAPAAVIQAIRAGVVLSAPDRKQDS
jgi:prepilin signal peptidase PulO-like enzyme (type II secretory pathway)